MAIGKYLAILAIAVAGLTATSAIAADYDPPLVVDSDDAGDEYKPVEIGSGWYLRGDLSYALNDKFKKLEVVGEYDSNTAPFSGSVGVGYHFNDYFRGDLNLGFLPDSKFKKDDTKVRCSGYRIDADGDFVATSDVPDPFYGRPLYPNQDCLQRDIITNNAYDLLASAYVDLGTFSGITPYIGGGIGAILTRSELELGQMNCINDQAFKCSDDRTQYMGEKKSETSVAPEFAVAVGLGYNVSDSMVFDIGYQYKSAPSATYYTISNDRLIENKGINSHNVKVGLRYDLW